MRELLAALSQAKDMIDVNIAAGLALERVDGDEARPPPGPDAGQSPIPVLKPI